MESKGWHDARPPLAADVGQVCRYDLKQLFIGAEGTLGVVTGVAVQCPPRSSSRQVAVLAVPSFCHAQQVSCAFEDLLVNV